MTRELFCTTRRRAVLNETMVHSTWISSPSVKTMCTLSQLSRRTSRSVRLINIDTPGFAWYCGNKQSRKPSSLRSSSASSSIRSCFNRAPNFGRHSRFAPTLTSSWISLASQALILKLHFSNCHNSTCFTLAASVVTARGFPHINCVVRINDVVELALSALVFALFRATLVWAICTHILLLSRFVDSQLIPRALTQHSRSACRDTRIHT